MHSAILRGTDFKIESNSQTISHSDFFSGFTIETRLGLVTPNGLDGIGAANLLLSYVTAFYDCHRKNSNQFHAYPEFYTFQCGPQITDYGMLDIYPIENNIRIKNSPEFILQTVIEQKINILLLPNKKSGQSKIDRELLEAVKKNVHTCFLYSAGGEIDNPNITIECHKPEIFDWIKEVADSMPDNKVTIPTLPLLKQSFLEISLESALENL